MSGPDRFFELRRVVTEGYRLLVPRAFLRVPHDPEERSRFLHAFFLRRSGEVGRDETASSRRAAQERFEESFRQGREADVEEFFVLDLEISGVRASGSLLLTSSALDLSTRGRAEEYVRRASADAEHGVGFQCLDFDSGGYAVAEVRKRIEDEVTDGRDIAALSRTAGEHLSAEARGAHAALSAEARTEVEARALMTYALNLSVPHPESPRAATLRLTTREAALFSPLSTVVISIAESLQFSTADGWADAIGAAAG